MEANPKKYFEKRNFDEIGISNQTRQIKSAERRMRHSQEQMKYKWFVQHKWSFLKEERGKMIDYFTNKSRCRKGIFELIRIIRSHIVLKRMKYLIDGMIY